MSDERNPAADNDQPPIYEIRIKGHLGRQWSEWFSNMTITLEDDGSTRLSGAIVDQAALHGLLKTIRDLGMPLISLNRIETD